MKSVTIIFLVTLFFFSSRLKAQFNISDKQPIYVGVNIANHSVTIPFYKVFNGKINPGISIDAERVYSNRKKSQWLQRANVGTFFNSIDGTGIYLNANIAYRYKSRQGLFFDAGAGLGYLHKFHPANIYRLHESGEYKREKDAGKPFLTINIPLSIGYNFKKIDRSPASIYFRYEPFIQIPNNKDIFFWPQALVGLGISYKI